MITALMRHSSKIMGHLIWNLSCLFHTVVWQNWCRVHIKIIIYHSSIKWVQQESFTKWSFMSYFGGLSSPLPPSKYYGIQFLINRATAFRLAPQFRLHKFTLSKHTFPWPITARKLNWRTSRRIRNISSFFIVYKVNIITSR